MQVQKAELSNGITVVHTHLPDAQDYRIDLNVPIGAQHDPMGKAGLSHILEHTVFCGTETTAEVDIDNAIGAAGGRTNAHTGNDKTSFDITASARDASHFPLIVEFMRQIMTEPLFEPARVGNEIKIIINERADGIDNLMRNPLVELTRIMQEKTGASVNIIGAKESILSVTSEDLRSFMQENYDAGQMVLYVAGPVSFNDTMDLLEQTLSGLPNLKSAEKPRHAITPSECDERVKRPELLQNYNIYMFAPNEAKTLREHLIKDEATKQLHQQIHTHLRREHGCFYSSGVSQWSADEVTGLNALHFSSTPEDSVIAAEGLVAFMRDMDDIITDGIIEGSIADEIYKWSQTLTSSDNVLDDVKKQYESFGSLSSIDRFVETYNSITPEEVRDSAREILSSLSGIYVQGPEPDRVPELAVMQEALALKPSANDNKPKAVPTAAFALNRS